MKTTPILTNDILLPHSTRRSREGEKKDWVKRQLPSPSSYPSFCQTFSSYGESEAQRVHTREVMEANRKIQIFDCSAVKCWCRYLVAIVKFRACHDVAGDLLSCLIENWEGDERKKDASTGSNEKRIPRATPFLHSKKLALHTYRL